MAWSDDLRNFGYAPGNYIFTCQDCPPNLPFLSRPMGAKLSWRCEAHAKEARDNYLEKQRIEEATYDEWKSENT